MANIKIDLNQFKHVKSDDKTTTLRHRDGHELTLAHKSLSPEGQSQLQALSKIGKEAQTKSQSREAANKMAEGGKVCEEQPKKEEPKKPAIKPATIPRPDKGHGAIIQKKAEGGDVEMMAEGGATEEPSLWESFKDGVPANLKEDIGKLVDYLGAPGKAGAEMAPAVSEKLKATGLLPTQVDPSQIHSGQPGVITPASGVQYTPPPTSQQAPAASPQVPEQEVHFSPEQVAQATKQDVTPQQPVQDMDASSPAPAPKAPASVPEAAPQVLPPEPPKVQTFQEHVAQLKAQALKEGSVDWAKDLSDGHITPKTYSSLLYDGKTMLGKIGTIFGLMVGSAGAGLSGQPNALLDMMNKTIQNDLEAQKQSKGNAQNLLRLSQQHEMNQAQIAQMQKQGNLTEAQTKVMGIEGQTKAYALANMRANQIVLHDLALKVQKYPVGSPQRQQAEATLAMISSGVQNENYRLADRAAAAQAMMNYGFGSQDGQAGDPEDAFKKRQMFLRRSGQEKIADDMEKKHMTGADGLATRDIPEDTRRTVQAMNILDNKGREVLDFIKQNSGTLDPKKRAVAQQKVEEMKNFYNDSIKGGALTEGRLHWYDEQFKKTPTDILSQFMGSTARLQEMVDSNLKRRDEVIEGLGLRPRASTYQSPNQGQETAPKEGQTGTLPDGRKVQVINGKIHLVK